ncbi:cytochrome P450 [Actinorhabdospora filicis]|uniref:Cytochrome P450 n=1 Tax=Actinorhabdospora filicis TaxID=1785913 RepID=A0A9W6SI53_9ACTN|nr:cytochrome P450 [Actinorhabdospora filicis]GLZ76392.1 cytochrome P450 [Actinorhabdospora filicis]
MTEATIPFQRQGFDPVAAIGDLRRRRPVTRLEVPIGPPIWLVTRYEDVKAVLGDTERFSNDFSNITALEEAGISVEMNPGGLGFADPPDHTRLRKLLTPEFTMRRLKRLVPRIEAIVTEALDEMERRGPGVDLVETFALPIPALVVCELLGVRYEDRVEFLRHAEDRFDLSGDILASIGAMSQSLDYLEDLVARERRDPGDGLLGALLREHGEDLDDRELAGIADGVLTGGHDTSTSMLALGSLHLLTNPDHAKTMVGDDADAHDLVEELLRYMTVVQVAFPRFAREDLTVGGQDIAKGDMVLCSLSSANRDDAIGAGLEAVAPERSTSSSHMAFGYGIHRCVGAELARMELRIAYPALLRRFPGLRMGVPFEDLRFRELSIVYGVEKLPVEW